MKRQLIAVALMLVCVSATSSLARHRNSVDANGNTAPGVVVSHKTGATARVAIAHVAKFQAYIDAIEAQGASVRFMGGIRRGHCWSGGMHPCGRALDVCQTGRGRVDPRCHLPSRHELARIAAAHGLFEGGQWCNSDYGHVQVGESAAACGRRHQDPPTTMIAQRTNTVVTASAKRRSSKSAAVFQPIDRLTQIY